MVSRPAAHAAPLRARSGRACDRDRHRHLRRRRRARRGGPRSPTRSRSSRETCSIPGCPGGSPRSSARAPAAWSSRTPPTRMRRRAPRSRASPASCLRAASSSSRMAASTSRRCAPRRAGRGRPAGRLRLARNHRRGHVRRAARPRDVRDLLSSAGVLRGSRHEHNRPPRARGNGGRRDGPRARREAGRARAPDRGPLGDRLGSQAPVAPDLGARQTESARVFGSALGYCDS